MNSDIQLISDGAGVAVIGEPSAVERFLAAEGLPSEELDLNRATGLLSSGAAVVEAGSAISENSGRWVKLTAESAKKMSDHKLMPVEGKSNVKYGVVVDRGRIKSLLQFETQPTTILTNPAMLAGVAGIMAQLAMKQQMAEITEYLASIDAKLDDVLRAQRDTVLAQMIGVGLQIDAAMTMRDHVGRVNDVMWSQIESTSGTIAATQAYALLQLDALASKLERKNDVGELAKTTKEAERTTREWLAVLARSFQLQDAISVLELDRVLETTPEDLDGHRTGLLAARQQRLDAITRTTQQLLERLEASAGIANEKVLLHPASSRVVVESSNQVGAAVTDFQARLGIERERRMLEARRWTDAAIAAKDTALETGAEGIDAARRIASETGDAAKSATGRLSERFRRKNDS